MAILRLFATTDHIVETAGRDQILHMALGVESRRGSTPGFRFVWYNASTERLTRLFPAYITKHMLVWAAGVMPDILNTRTVAFHLRRKGAKKVRY